MVTEGDRQLRRFEGDAVIAGISMAGLAAVLSRGRWDVAGGVLGGALLVGLGYMAVKGAVDAIAGRAGGPGEARLTPRQRALAAVKFFTRYALLAVGAYAMLTCFRLHPVGLLAGAASPFVAALVQVVRLARAR